MSNSRRKQVLTIASCPEQISWLLTVKTIRKEDFHCIALSHPVHYFCSTNEIDVSPASDYLSVAGMSFSEEGLALSIEWTKAAFTILGYKGREELINLSTRFNYFFSTMAFALELASSAISRFSPSLVFVGLDEGHPIVGDTLLNHGFEAVVAHTFASYADQIGGVSVEYIPKTETPSNIVPPPPPSSAMMRSKLGGLRRILPSRLKGKLYPFKVFQFKLRKKAKQAFDHYLANWPLQRIRLRLLAIHWKRRILKKPFILHWGDSVDGAYQAFLALEFSQKRKWITQHFESMQTRSLLARSTTAYAHYPLGLDMQKALQFAAPPVRDKSPPIPHLGILVDRLAERLKEHEKPVLRILGSNKRLFANQLQAMIQNIAWTFQDVSRHIRLLDTWKPDLIVVQRHPNMAIAGKRKRIPVLDIAHGIVVAPYFTSLHGTANIVAGSATAHGYKQLEHVTGTIFSGGFIGVPGISKTNTSFEKGVDEVRITLLPVGSYKFFYPCDYRTYEKCFQTIAKESKNAGSKLLVKFHPRSGSEHEKMFQEILKPYELALEFSKAPTIKSVLAQSSIVIATETTSGIWEVAQSDIPLICAFYHTPWQFRPGSSYYKAFSEFLLMPHNDDELSCMIEMLLKNAEFRQKALERQQKLSNELCTACGEDAANFAANVAEQLLR